MCGFFQYLQQCTWVPGIDFKGYTRSEFEQLRQKGNPFIQLILEEGIVLLDEIGVFKNEQ